MRRKARTQIIKTLRKLVVLGAPYCDLQKLEQIHNISQKGQSLDSLFFSSTNSKRFLQSIIYICKNITSCLAQ